MVLTERQGIHQPSPRYRSVLERVAGSSRQLYKWVCSVGLRRISIDSYSNNGCSFPVVQRLAEVIIRAGNRAHFRI